MVDRKVRVGASAIALAVFAMGGSAKAEDQFSLATTATIATDYIFRGISYSDSSPTLNVYNELGYSIFYLAFWTTNVDYGPIGPWEQDVYFGARPVTGPINWDLSVSYVLYGNRDTGAFGSMSDTDYYEFKVGATTSPFKDLTIGANVFWMPDQDYAATENLSLEAIASYALPKIGKVSPSISGLLGYSKSGTNQYYTTGMYFGEEEYTYWNAGVKLDIDNYFVDIRYWGTDLDNELSDDRVLLSLGVNLAP